MTNFNKNEESAIQYIKKNKMLYLFLVPSIVYFILFKYLPIFGNVIAFKDYSIAEGFLKSKWVGLEHFRYLFFESRDFWQIFRNTILIALYRIVWGFPVPIILALLLNEVRKNWFKKLSQTIVYLPHFISWVVIGGLVHIMLSASGGPVNELITKLGGDPIRFLQSKDWFRTVLIVSSIYKEAGYGTVIYLAALSGIDMALYEASTIDGASRLQKIRYITLPGIIPTAMIVLIINVGKVIREGFEQVLILYNPVVYDVADIIQTYSYRVGLQQGRFSYATAIGLFESVIAFVLIMGTNLLVRKVNGNEGGLW